MLKYLSILAVAVAIASGMTCAAQTNSKVVIPVKKISPVDGKQMYKNYCAPCHGIDGKGNGPVAGALKSSPTDLTLLSRNNKGQFPDTHLVSVMEFGSNLPAHGSAQMPVWGPILGKMNQMNAMDKQLRISNLSSYIKSLQVK